MEGETSKNGVEREERREGKDIEKGKERGIGERREGKERERGRGRETKRCDVHLVQVLHGAERETT